MSAMPVTSTAERLLTDIWDLAPDIISRAAEIEKPDLLPGPQGLDAALMVSSPILTAP
jgi:hypothetical protein